MSEPWLSRGTVATPHARARGRRQPVPVPDRRRIARHRRRADVRAPPGPHPGDVGIPLRQLARVDLPDPTAPLGTVRLLALAVGLREAERPGARRAPRRGAAGDAGQRRAGGRRTGTTTARPTPTTSRSSMRAGTASRCRRTTAGSSSSRTSPRSRTSSTTRSTSAPFARGWPGRRWRSGSSTSWTPAACGPKRRSSLPDAGQRRRAPEPVRGQGAACSAVYFAATPEHRGARQGRRRARSSCRR